MLINFHFYFQKIYFSDIFLNFFCSFGENDSRCFYQSLLYNSRFDLAPEITIEDFSSRFLFANENLNSLLVKF